MCVCIDFILTFIYNRVNETFVEKREIPNHILFYCNYIFQETRARHTRERFVSFSSMKAAGHFVANQIKILIEREEEEKKWE